MRVAVIINCNNVYVGKGIVALKNFKSYNQDADMFIIGTKFSEKSHALAEDHGVKLIEVDLNGDLIKFNQRPYRSYPIECFYHFYAHVCLPDYDYIVTTEPDIYFNKTINQEIFEAVDYIGVSYNESLLNRNYAPIMKDIHKFREALGYCEVTGYRPLSGVRIYNVSGLKEINYYNEIIDIYQKCWEVERPICGDDGMVIIYQIYHPEHVTMISTDLMIIVHDFGLEHVNQVYSFHFGDDNKKYWDKRPAKTEVEKYFRNKMIEYVCDNFSDEFIKEHLPTLY